MTSNFKWSHAVLALIAAALVAASGACKPAKKDGGSAAKSEDGAPETADATAAPAPADDAGDLPEPLSDTTPEEPSGHAQEIAFTMHGAPLNAEAEYLPEVTEDEVSDFWDEELEEEGLSLLGVARDADESKGIEGLKNRRKKQRDYIATCEAAGVPIPPDWGDPKWVAKGKLPKDRTFALGVEFEAQLFIFTNDKGKCAALPRGQKAGYVEALGIVCQGTNGKACFWDNVDALTQPKERKIHDPAKLKIANLAGGSVLGENCTECHRGDNAFIVHYGTTLQDELENDLDVRYQPIGQANWQNPEGPPKKEFASGCQSCHTLPKLSYSYCWTLLMPSIKPRTGTPTMPPDGKVSDARYKELQAACLKLKAD